MRITASLVLPLAAAAMLGLTGCAGLEDLAHREAESGYDDAAELRSDWSKSDTASWLPDDASDIHVRESTTGDTAVIRFDSASGPDSADCGETQRFSLPAYVDEWTPDDEEVVKRDTVLACGEWAVIDIEGHWFGWTPSAPGEQETAP